MKRFVKACLVFAAMMVMMSIANNVVLLKLHDLAYYYTLEGMKLAAIVCGIEALLTLAIVGPLFRLIVGEEELVKLGFMKKE